MYTKNFSKYKVFIMIITIIFLAVNKVDAASCTSTEKNNLIKEAKNVEIVPYLDEEYNPLHEYKYNVYITNFSNKFYVIDSKNNRFEYDGSYTNDSVFGMYEPGEKITFKIYGAYGEKCSDILLTNTTIRFDYYNDYSNYEECKGIEEFYLCKRNYSGEIKSEEWFLSQVKGYKEGTVENIEIEEKTEKEESFLDNLTAYFKENKIVSITLIIVIVAIVILLIINLRNKRKKVKVKFKDRGGKS